MFFGLTDEASELRAGVRDVLSTACPPSTVRAAWPGGDPSAVDKLWTGLGELGLLGLLVPEPAGGLDLGDLVAVAALEECGYAGVPGPVVESMAVAAVLPEPDLLTGSTRATVRRHDGPVPYAAVSPLVLDLPSGTLLRDPTTEPVASVDGSRALATVTGAGEPVSGDLDLLARRGVLGTAALLLGLARRQVDLTVEHVTGRQQFGVPIGSFQAVKHPLADAVVGTEFAWPAVLRAAHSLEQQDPAAGVHVSMAKALASDAAQRVSRVCLQAHGAMGHTTDYDLHLYAKRTWALAEDWGTATEHRARIADHLELS